MKHTEDGVFRGSKKRHQHIMFGVIGTGWRGVHIIYPHTQFLVCPRVTQHHTPGVRPVAVGCRKFCVHHPHTCTTAPPFWEGGAGLGLCSTHRVCSSSPSRLDTTGCDKLVITLSPNARRSTSDTVHIGHCGSPERGLVVHL